MNLLNGNWSGKILGTNNADTFIEIEEDNNNLTGTIRINDHILGPYGYQFTGSRDGRDFVFQGQPISRSQSYNQIFTVDGRPVTVETNNVGLGKIDATGKLQGENKIEGRWTSTIGTAGTFWATRTARNTHNTAFVMMSIPRDDPSVEDRLQAIRRGASKKNIEATRIDEIEHSTKITDLILENIKAARFLICDLTDERPNVYYELGYAHGLQKDVILVAKEGTTAHFDIKDYNIVFYKNLVELEERIARRIQAALDTD